MSFDSKYLVFALAYVVIGMCLGIYMAASHNHAEHVTHAHIMLVGFLLSFAYGIIHKLWLVQPSPTIAKVQFVLHHAAAVSMFTALFLLYGSLAPEEQLEPVLGISSVTVLVAALLMLYMVTKSSKAKT